MRWWRCECVCDVSVRVIYWWSGLWLWRWFDCEVRGCDLSVMLCWFECGCDCELSGMCVDVSVLCVCTWFEWNWEYDWECDCELSGSFLIAIWLLLGCALVSDLSVIAIMIVRIVGSVCVMWVPFVWLSCECYGSVIMIVLVIVIWCWVVWLLVLFDWYCDLIVIAFVIVIAS